MNGRFGKTLLVLVVLGMVSLAALVPGVAALGGGATAPEQRAAVDGTVWQRIFRPLTPSALTAAEAEGLLFMREEEKLARDVYVALYDQWGVPVFDNIAGSEQAHMDAVKTLLDRYDLADPAAGTEPGEFANVELQALYDELVATGMQSLEQALRAGAAIEEIDILDLQERVAETDKADIRRVYDNLAAGSGNHLRAFASTLSTQEGVTYQPQYLSAEAYAEIIAASTPRGRGRGNR